MEYSELPLVGQKVTLRSGEDQDLELWEIWMKSGHRWKEFDAPYYPLPSEEEGATMLKRKREEIERGPCRRPPHSLVISDRKSNVFLGVVTWYWESKETCRPGLGIVNYDEGQWGRGVGYEALGPCRTSCSMRCLRSSGSTSARGPAIGA